MRQEEPRASVVVAIGGDARLYYALITSAPHQLDAPATITLHAATPAEMAVFASSDVVIDADDARKGARLVLIASTELSWLRARCHEGQHVLAPADAGLIRGRALQNWLWRRLVGLTDGNTLA